MGDYLTKALQDAPVFASQDDALNSAWQLALHTLLDISTVPCPAEEYNKTGLWSADPGLMIRAGGTYPTPWTRDAAINTMNAACYLEPEVAKNTLWAVCERLDGQLCFQMDKQSWDKIVWAVGAWSYYLATGDEDFLRDAYAAITNSLALLEKERYNADYGLFMGGSFFNDGITGYPARLHQPGNGSSFVGRHPDTAFIMTLSTNCLYAHACGILAEMARQLYLGEETVSAWTNYAEALKTAINRWFWREDIGRYGYLLYPDGVLDLSQEGCGLSFAILFGLCDEARAKRIIAGMHRNPRGLASIWPPFEGISSVEKPLRHNNLIWPFVNAFYADAAAKCGRGDLLAAEMKGIAELALASDGFYEIYNAETGVPDGGWQVGLHWDSVPEQTWSATGYIRMVISALFGVRMGTEAVSFAPCMPEGMGTVRLTGLRVRGMTLDLILHEKDPAGARTLIDGEEAGGLAYGEAGRHCVEMWA